MKTRSEISNDIMGDIRCRKSVCYADLIDYVISVQDESKEEIQSLLAEREMLRLTHIGEKHDLEKMILKLIEDKTELVKALEESLEFMQVVGCCCEECQPNASEFISKTKNKLAKIQGEKLWE